MLRSEPKVKRSARETISEDDFDKMLWRASQYERNEKCLIHAQKNAVFWQGKFSMVKHENNMLRKKLRRQEYGVQKK